MDALATADIVLFEGFRLDRRGLFRRDESGAFVPVAIGSRALEILGVLIERPGDLVSRDEIMTAVWPGTVVESSNLPVQVAALRRVLDDGRAEGSCIQTVAGRGYRFIVAVTRLAPATPPTPPSGNGSRAPIAKNGHLRGPEAGIIGTVILALALVAAVAGWNWYSLWFGDARPAPRLSIVVLPFTNLSDDREQQYFADGVTEDLTTDLSRIADSFVISRNTAFTYKDKPVDAKQIGRELGVRYVLEGSVQRSGKQVRVNAQLINAETDAHLWAERFERDTDDLFALQNEITGRIGNALNVELITVEAARPTADPDALDYILRGRAAFAKGPARDNLAEAIGLFERALSIDPRSVGAQGLLAQALMSRVLEAVTDSRAADIARAEGLIGQVVAAAPGDARAHFAKGQMLRAQGRCEEALPEYEAVIASNRNFAAALINIGQCRMLTGLLTEAIPPMEQAIRLDPRNPFIGSWYNQIGGVHLLQSRIDEAILWLEKSRSANPGRPGVHVWLASAYGLKGETERAAAELAEARRLRGEGSYASTDRMRRGYWGVPKTRALFEATYFAGLRKAGMPEE
jgi:TolB-like protein/DNA-binding winged helix-turn-helix (wHTH) protein/Tfp pilus assembly protein PilF